MGIWLSLLGVAVGLAILVKSADVFVDGAASLATRCGLSPLLVGAIVVGFGTSMPELTVSFLSALEGNPCIALGNAYGSNIANICLILGLTAAICPIAVAPNVLKRELPVLLIITVISGLLIINNGVISRLDAAIMLVVFFIVIARNIIHEKKNPQAVDEVKVDERSSLGNSILKILGGLLFLVLSSQILVKCAIYIASALGVPDLVIGLTIVAVGTSLPELASSLAAIRRKEHDLALGNIVGSNLFNTLAVVGLAGITRPMVLNSDADSIKMVLVRDYPLMFFVTIFLLIVCIPFRRGRPAVINRLEGLFLLIVYICYLAYLVMESL